MAEVYGDLAAWLDPDTDPRLVDTAIALLEERRRRHDAGA